VKWCPALSPGEGKAFRNREAGNAFPGSHLPADIDNAEIIYYKGFPFGGGKVPVSRCLPEP